MEFVHSLWKTVRYDKAELSPVRNNLLNISFNVTETKSSTQVSP